MSQEGANHAKDLGNAQPVQKLTGHNVTVPSGKFPDANQLITTDADFAYLYARKVLRKRFIPGEAAIAKGPDVAFEYVKTIVRKPWPLGEAAISKVPSYAFEYALNILMGPFPLGENAISRDTELSHRYAREVLRGPFPQGEQSIEKDIALLIDYKLLVLNPMISYSMRTATRNRGVRIIGLTLYGIKNLTKNEEAKMSKLIRLALVKVGCPPDLCEWNESDSGGVEFLIRFPKNYRYFGPRFSKLIRPTL